MKVETYKIKNWKKAERGLLIAENKHWILVKHIPVDYVVDGFKLYRKKFIKERVRGTREKQIERVLSLKKTKMNINIKGFKFNNILDILKWSEKKFGLFEFQDKEEDELIYGKINHTKKDLLIIDMIMSDGKIKECYDFEFSLKKIRIITFETDYFNSVRLLVNDENKHSKTK